MNYTPSSATSELYVDTLCVMNPSFTMLPLLFSYARLIRRVGAVHLRVAHSHDPRSHPSRSP